MITPYDILWGVAAPFGVAIVLLLLAHLPTRRRRQRDAQPWGVAVALATGFAIAFVAIHGPPGWPPPRLVQGWLPYVGGAAALVAILATATRGRPIIAGPISMALLAVTAWLIARPRQSTLGQAFWPSVATVAVGMSAWWLGMELLARRTRGPTLPTLLASVCGAAALVLVDSGTQTLGQICGSLAVVLAAAGLLAFWLRNVSLANGAVLTTGVLLLGVLLCGYYYADVSKRDLALLSAAPLAAWVGELVPARKWILRFGVRAAAVLIVIALPLGHAVKGLKKTMQEQTESYQY